jgi:hypothetical protein
VLKTTVCKACFTFALGAVTTATTTFAFLRARSAAIGAACVAGKPVAASNAALTERVARATACVFE